MQKMFLLFFTLIVFAACESIETSYSKFPEGEKDHSSSNFEKAKCTHLDWTASIDFDKKIISGTAAWKFQQVENTDEIIFDIKALNIKEVTINDKKIEYKIRNGFQEEGQALVIPIAKNDSLVKITYETTAESEAIQWLEPEQTAGKKNPYLFTQCESIYARSLMPCQDAPANRITYNAHLQTPVGMMAVMSAKNPTAKSADGKYNFEMELPIPTYLIALAVGDIEYKAINAQCGVYTEPIMLDKCAKELEDMPKMIAAAEKIGGPYRWGKYDVLVCPPSFPIGGMENPRLTFATPTIIAGDKSLVSLIAHELAHSWSGNLVTNSNWNDLWLNEGFTSYFEKRIMEEITDKDYTNMLWEISHQDLENDLKNFGFDNPDTRLKIDVKDRHPEDAFSSIPYDKGAYFLKSLETAVGRPTFDKWLTNYFSAHAFVPMNTKMAIEDMKKNLPLDQVHFNVEEWIYESGLPKNIAYQYPEKFKIIDSLRTAFLNGLHPEKLNARNWSTHEWLHFLRKLPRPVDLKLLSLLDASYQLTHTTNFEIADEWYLIALQSNYAAANNAMDNFILHVGRKKFLEPLYSELIKTESGKKRAYELLQKAEKSYHPLTTKKIKSIIEK